MHVLVVGANGQLGAACCRALLNDGHRVRGSVRALSRAMGLGLGGVDLVETDLTVHSNLSELLDGVDAAVLTANAAVPRRGDDPALLAVGLHRLIAAAGHHRVQRLVLPSFPIGSVDAQVPMADERRRQERHMLEAVPDSVVLRLPPFMECWVAMVGTSITVRGESNATVLRPSPFLRAFRAATGTLVERRGIMLVPGSAQSRQAFIAVPDVAAAVVAALARPETAGRTIDVAGPDVLSWDDVAKLFTELLGRSVRPVETPAWVYAAAAALLRPVATVPSRTMALNRYLASVETPWTHAGGGLVDPGTMTTLRDLLTQKLALPQQTPAQPAR